MKAFALKSPGDAGYINVPAPELTPHGALLKPIAISLCTTDIHTIYTGSPKAPNLILGHECVAEILSVGQHVNDFKPGDIVAVPAITPDWTAPSIQDGNHNHANAPFSGHQLGRTLPGVFAEMFAIPHASSTLAKVPEGVSIEQALLSVDVITTGFTGAECADIKFGDTVCVLGIGPIGLMAIVGAKLRGAGEIIAVGNRKISIEVAKIFGATHIFSYKNEDIEKNILALTNGIGVDSTIIAGGNDDTFIQAFNITRYGIGTISNISYVGGTGNIPIPKFSSGRGMAGKTVRMELAKGGRARIERILNMIKLNRFDPSPLITHRLHGFDKIGQALNMMREKSDDMLKIAIYTQF